VNIRPQLEEQLSDLEAMAQDLEGEMQVKDDVVQRLTDSLNRSLGSTATEDQDVGKFSSAPAAESSPAPQDAPPEREAHQRLGLTGLLLLTLVLGCWLLQVLMTAVFVCRAEEAPNREEGRGRVGGIGRQKIAKPTRRTVAPLPFACVLGNVPANPANVQASP
jgi:hypothetical protein